MGENSFFLISYIIWMMVSVTPIIFFSYILDSRWKKLPRWFHAVVFAIAAMVPEYFKLKYMDDKVIGSICYWIAVILLLASLAVMFRDKIWKKIAAFLSFILIAHIAETIALFLYRQIYQMTFQLAYDSVEYLVLLLTNSGIIMILSAVFIMLWNKIMYRTIRIQNMLVFLIFPISQILWCLNLSTMHSTFSKSEMATLLGLVLGLCADFGLLYVMIEQAEKEETERKLQELEQLQKVEEAHYQAVETHRVEMNKLRHDYKNQLAAVYRLIESQDIESGKVLLQEINEAMDAVKEMKYCNHAIVNAVLVEKEKLCEAHHIKLIAEVDMKAEMNIKPIHLCSLFSNLLDNAIKASAECQESDPAICVSAGMRGAYFSIRVTNPSLNPVGKIRRRQGYGKEILKNIAERYEGEYSDKWEDGIYTVKISVVNESR